MAMVTSWRGPAHILACLVVALTFSRLALAGIVLSECYTLVRENIIGQQQRMSLYIVVAAPDSQAKQGPKVSSAKMLLTQQLYDTETHTHVVDAHSVQTHRLPFWRPIGRSLEMPNAQLPCPA